MRNYTGWLLRNSCVIAKNKAILIYKTILPKPAESADSVLPGLIRDVKVF